MNRKEDPNYIPFVQMTGGFVVLLAGYIMAVLVHIITILKMNLIYYITTIFICVAMVDVQVRKTSVTSHPYTNRLDEGELEIIKL